MSLYYIDAETIPIHPLLLHSFFVDTMNNAEKDSLFLLNQQTIAIIESQILLRILAISSFSDGILAYQEEEEIENC